MREAKTSLLSAVLRSREAALKAGEDLQREALSGEFLKIYDVSMGALDSGVRPDKDTVVTRLKAKDEWNEKTELLLEEITSKRVAPRNVGMFIDTVNNHYIQETALDICAEANSLVEAKEIQGEEVVDFLERNILDIESEGSRGFRSMEEVADSMEQRVSEAMQQDGTVGVPSGLDALDSITGGFLKSKLYVIAARPAMGKSSLAGTIMFNSASEGHRNAGYLLEMDAESFGMRRAAKQARLNSFDLRMGNISEEEEKRFKKAKEEISGLPIWLNDTPGMTVEQVYRKVRRLDAKYGVDIVWVDYLQLLENSGDGSKNEEVGHMSRMLKLTAKELDIPVVALSQLNRKVEYRSPPKPQLSDLRASGNIEQDADVVIMIYRPEQYGITVDENGDNVEGIAELLVEKHRGGPTGKAEVHFNDKYATFEPLANYDPF